MIDECCQVCMGMGVYPVHADDCDDHLCSFGVGQIDCNWSMVDCDACDGTGVPLVRGPGYAGAVR